MSCLGGAADLRRSSEWRLLLHISIGRAQMVGVAAILALFFITEYTLLDGFEAPANQAPANQAQLSPQR